MKALSRTEVPVVLSLPARAEPGLGKDSCTWNNDKDSVALSLVLCFHVSRRHF